MVSSLMTTGENKWDVDLIQDIFDIRDVNLILEILLQQHETDRWYWNKEKFEFYSVKTAYIMIQ